jgi:TonB-dependent receptor
MNKKSTILKVSAIALAVGQAFAPQAMAQTDDASAVVVVTGLRASARSSVAIKRDAMEVVDSITAEDIGKLPDPNVAETLTRIPGVQGYRYGGESASPAGFGSGLTIRGLANQTASQVNGRSYFTAGSREFNIEDAIPGMVAGVDVYKNPSAEHIEGGIGGLVNVRTRNPSDFKGFTAALSANLRYNDLAKEKDPELFGLVANRFDLGGGSRIGVMAAVAFQKSTGRSDSTPAGRGPDYRRAIRADSAEYAGMAAANTGNAVDRPMAAYVGRSDVHFLADVPTLPTSATGGAYMPNTAGMSADQVANIITTSTATPNVFQETIMRERRGLNLAADYRVDNSLRFYVEGNYTHYLYHQNYRFLFIDQGRNVRNLQTTPFTMTEDLANRNFNGGSNDVLSTQRLLGGTFLNSTIRPWGGDEHSPYTTWTTAAGAEWSPNEALSLKADVSYIKATRKQDNRRVEMATRLGRSWEVTRLADGVPHQVSFNGPDLADANNFVYQQYAPATYQTWNDDGVAAALSGAYIFEQGLFQRLKFGTRYATVDSLYRTRNGFGNRPLTSDGLPLNASQSNAIAATAIPGVLQHAPDNYMRGDAGYSGGYVVYNPDALLGNRVRENFPLAGMPLEGAYPETLANRRNIEERTLAGYVSGEFAAFDDRLKGAIGVRVVRTNSKATARVAGATPGSLNVVTRSVYYNNVLPSFNATYELSKDFLARFGYGRGMTRPVTGDLNPFISVNAANGTASVGNPALAPQVANSVDLSLERYFTPTNYVALGVFNKDIKGFFNDVAECGTVPLGGAFTGSTPNGCTNGQWMITRKVNGEKGHARGAELSGQWFFDKHVGWLKNFGVAASYTYVDTANPVNTGTVTAQRIIETHLPFVSKNSSSVSIMYENQKLSARLVHTWRSSQQLGGVNGVSPFNSSYVKAYSLVDASANYNFDDHLTLSMSVSNITDKTLDRYTGEAMLRETGLGHQHFANGRTFSMGLRYKF